MQAGEFMVVPGLALLLAIAASSANATRIVELSPIEANRGAETLTMNTQSPGDARCSAPDQKNCDWEVSQAAGAWAQASIVEVATEPSALRALLEREWMLRLEGTEASYFSTAPRAAISSTRR